MKAGRCFALAGKTLSQDLDRKRLVHQHVHGSVNRAHATVAKLLLNAIASSDDSPDHRVDFRHRGIVAAQRNAIARAELLPCIKLLRAYRADRQSVLD